MLRAAVGVVGGGGFHYMYVVYRLSLYHSVGDFFDFVGVLVKIDGMNLYHGCLLMGIVLDSSGCVDGASD